MISGEKQNSNLFLQLLFPLRDAPIQNSSGYSFEDLFTLANKHQLFPLVYNRLSSVDAKGQMESSLAQFVEQGRAIYLKVIAYSLKLEAQEQEIISLLQSEGLPALVFKGTAIAGEFYGDPGVRASVDIDILVRKCDMSKIDRALNKAAYNREGSLPFAYLFHRIQHAVYKKRTGGVPVEVHWTFGVPWFFDLSSDEIWEGVSQNREGGYALSPDMLIVMLLMHHHLHYFRELRILVDLLWAFEKYSEVVDWKQFAARLHKIGLLKTARIVLVQMQDIWGERTRELRAVGELERELKGLNVAVPGWLYSYFRMGVTQEEPRQIYKDKFYSRLVLDRWENIIGSYFKTLFPPPDAITALYKDERMWMLPVNYLRFMKWRIGDWVGGR